MLSGYKKNNNMKKVFLLTLAVAFTSVGFAQGNQAISAKADRVENTEKTPSAEERAKKRTEKLTAELKLDAKQQKVVYEVTLDEITKRERAKMQREEMKERHASSMERSNERIAEVLNPEQKAAWEKICAEHGEKRGSSDKAKADCGSKSASKACCSEKKK